MNPSIEHPVPPPPAPPEDYEAPVAAMHFRAIREDQPGERLAALYARSKPGYERWFLREGDAARPSWLACERALRHWLPELWPTFERVLAAVGDGDRTARFLSLYQPTPFLAGCSQAAWARESVALVRNYDYSPRLADGVLLYTHWNSTPVIAMSDCLWGVLDGMNGHGLAVSMAFGGRRAVGDGFGITLILRYVLEFCRDVPDALAVLTRVPVHMAYNVALVDRGGQHATVYLGPERPPLVSQERVSTNNQGSIEMPDHARTWETVRRDEYLRFCVDAPYQNADALTGHFLVPPLYRNGHVRGWGTLYTAAYHPHAGTMALHWPQAGSWWQGFGAFVEGEREVAFGGRVS